MVVHKVFLLILPLLWVAVSVWAVWGRGNWPYEAVRDWIWLGVTLFLVLEFVIYVGGVDPDPTYVNLANLVTRNRMISLQDVSPKVSTIRDTYRLDTDNDDVKEWVTFVKHEAKAYSAAVYDILPCRDPEIVTFPLTPIDSDYVAETLDNTFTNPWSGPYMSNLAGAVSKKVLVIHSRDTQTLNIFRWFDLAGEKCENPKPNERGYEVIGTFRGNGGVKLDGSRVVVTDRNGFERSQFALEKVYVPTGGTYLSAAGTLLPPVEGRVRFAFDQPQDLHSTFYPEKAVLAFYLSLFHGNPGTQWKPQEYLSKEKLKSENQRSGGQYDLDTSTFGLDAPHSEISEARVVGISYDPDSQAERTFQPRQVIVEVVPVNKDGKIIGRLRYVTWTVVAEVRAGAAPYGCEWKLDEITSIADGE